MHKFSDHFEVLSMQLPKSGVRLLGDYNVDLLKMNTAPNSTGNHTRFEELYMKAGLSPVISIPTHSRINCKPSCIDNIFTNDTEKVLLSGCITDSIGDHYPIFEISFEQLKPEPKSQKILKHYDYSN